ncbi:MAG: hypothetical protein P8X85_12745 [Desulfobacterales bacterium]
MSVFFPFGADLLAEAIGKNTSIPPQEDLWFSRTLCIKIPARLLVLDRSMN